MGREPWLEASQEAGRVIDVDEWAEIRGLHRAEGLGIAGPTLTSKDVVDLRFALDVGVDLVAMSFVRTASDIDPVRAIMKEVGRAVPVLAKLERPEAVAFLDELVATFDGLIVARGDLGVLRAVGAWCSEASPCFTRRSRPGRMDQ